MPRRSKRLSAAMQQATKETRSRSSDTDAEASETYETSGSEPSASRVNKIFQEESVTSDSDSRPEESTSRKKQQPKSRPQESTLRKEQISESVNFSPQASSSHVQERKIQNTRRSSQFTRSAKKKPVVEHTSSSSNNDTIRPSYNRLSESSRSRIRTTAGSSEGNFDSLSSDDSERNTSPRRRLRREPSDNRPSTSGYRAGAATPANLTRYNSSSDGNEESQQRDNSGRRSRTQPADNRPSRSGARSGKAASANSRARKQSKPQRVLAEIKFYQNQTGFLIPKLPFSRVVREYLLSSYSGDTSNFRITVAALEALQEATETFITQLMQDSYRCALHRQRVTLMPIDIQLALMLKNWRI